MKFTPGPSAPATFRRRHLRGELHHHQHIKHASKPAHFNRSLPSPLFPRFCNLPSYRKNGTICPTSNTLNLPPSSARTPLDTPDNAHAAPKAVVAVAAPKSHSIQPLYTKTGLQHTRPIAAGGAICTICAGATHVCVTAGAVQPGYGHDRGGASAAKRKESGYEPAGGV